MKPFSKNRNRLRSIITPIIIGLIIAFASNYFYHLPDSKDKDVAARTALNSTPIDGLIKIEGSIHLEELYKKSLSFKVLPNEQDALDIWYHDGAGLSLNQFDQSGKHINTITLPTIDEPIGINRISDFFIYNEDSVFVYDAQYRRLLLVNQQSEVLNLWLINNYVPELSSGRNNEIVDVYKNQQNELKIDLTGYSNTYFQSDPNFTRHNSLVYQINLSTQQVSRGMPYPEKSAYRDYMFWSGAVPYVRKTNAGYLAVFPLDEKIYTYEPKLTPLDPVSSYPKNFPRAVGNQYGSPQKMNFARIDRKLNGFNLKTRGIFNTDNGQRFAKVYRAPLGDDDAIPNDYASFLQGDYQSKHYLQVFDVDNGELIKRYNDIEIGKMNLGNLLFIDQSGRYYFLKNDPESEESVIVICSINQPDDVKLTDQVTSLDPP